MLYEARGALVTDRRTVAKFCKSIGGVPLANHNFRAESLFFCSGSALAAIRGCSSTSTFGTARLYWEHSAVYVLWSETTVYSSYAISWVCSLTQSTLPEWYLIKLYNYALHFTMIERVIKRKSKKRALRFFRFLDILLIYIFVNERELCEVF